MEDLTKNNEEDIGTRIMREYIKDAMEVSKQEDVIKLYDEEVRRYREIEEYKKDAYEAAIHDTARKMLENDVGIQTILKCTGLSIEKIKYFIKE